MSKKKSGAARIWQSSPTVANESVRALSVVATVFLWKWRIAGDILRFWWISSVVAATAHGDGGPCRGRLLVLWLGCPAFLGRAGVLRGCFFLHPGGEFLNQLFCQKLPRFRAGHKFVRLFRF
jgi:hypothetical protein